MGKVGDIHSCACCGVRDFQKVHQVHVTQLFQLDPDQRAWYEEIPVKYRCYVTVHWHADTLFWLHQDLMVGEDAPVCGPCKSHLLPTKSNKKPTKPPHSIASGKNFGRQHDMPALTDLEHRMVARVRSTVNTVKLVPAGNGAASQWGIRGHTIWIPHEGPEKLAERLPNLEGLRGTKVIFVVKASQWKSIRTNDDSRVERIFTPNWENMVRWLRVLKEINPHYENIHIVEQEPADAIALKETFLDTVSIADHPEVIAAETLAGADIANRDRAQGGEIMDAVMLADGRILARDEDDGPQVIANIKELLKDAKNTTMGRDPQAMNKFRANDRLLHLSYPCLFMCGIGVQSHYGMNTQSTRRLLVQHDNRFAECKDFLLLLFNQKFRHTALRTVADKLRTNPKLTSAPSSGKSCFSVFDLESV